MPFLKRWGISCVSIRLLDKEGVQGYWTEVQGGTGVYTCPCPTDLTFLRGLQLADEQLTLGRCFFGVLAPSEAHLQSRDDLPHSVNAADQCLTSPSCCPKINRNSVSLCQSYKCNHAVCRNCVAKRFPADGHVQLLNQGSGGIGNPGGYRSS